MSHRWNIATLTACSAICLGLAACGGDDGGDSEPEAVEDPQVTMASEQSASNAALIKDGAGTEAELKAKIQTLGGSIQALRSSYVAYQAKGAAADVQGAAGNLPTATGGQEAEVPEAEVPGGMTSVTFENNHLTASFTYEQNISGQNVVLNYIASMDIVAGEGGTTIDGNFDLSYDISIDTSIYAAAAAAQGGQVPDSINVEYEMHAVYAGVTVGQCASAGTLTLNYKANVEVEGGSSAISDALADNPEYGEGTITVTYGKDESGACSSAVEAQ